MKRFGEAVLFRTNATFFQKCKFFFFGYDFIGAHIRLGHFTKALSFLHKEKKDAAIAALDAGCGAGDFSFFLAERNPLWHISSYDIKENSIREDRVLQKKMEISNITFALCDISTLHEKEKYDFVFSIGTLIYFSKQQTKEILRKLTHALKRGGYLYLDLPQEDFLEVDIISPKHYPQFYTALKQENSGDLYTLDEIKNLLEELGFTLVFSNKSFSFPGKFAWELDNVLKEHRLFRLRTFLLPFLILLARFDNTTKHKKGCCFVLLMRKG